MIYLLTSGQTVGKTGEPAAVLAGDYFQEASYLFQHENSLITKDGQQMQLAMRVTKPDVVLLDNLMTHDECGAFCELSKSTLTKSMVVDDATGESVKLEYRISMGTYFTLGQNDLVKKIETRIMTLIMYLNDVKVGGATVLPNINLNVYPNKGAALYFSYFNSKGQVDPSTLHDGASVVEGEKWIATKWIRERVYA